MNNQNIGKIYRTNLIMWFALLMSQFMFTLVIYFVKPELFNFDFSKSMLGESIGLVIGLAFLAVVNFGLSFFLKSLYLKQAIEEGKPEIVQTAQIMAYAFCESITLFGLVAAFAENYQYFLAFFTLGIFGILLHFPRIANFTDANFGSKKI